MFDVAIYFQFVDMRRQLRKEAKATLEEAWAKSTRKIMGTQQQLYLDFCMYFNLQALPASVDTLCLFAQFMAREFQAADSIRNYLNGVKWLHILQGHNVGQFQHIILENFIEGTRP